MNTTEIGNTATIIFLEDWAVRARAGERPFLPQILNEKLADSIEPLLDQKTQDAITAPGFAVAFDPDEAERMGAFAETALTEQDAIESAPDLIEREP
jgi:hypothetical protein